MKIKVILSITLCYLLPHLVLANVKLNALFSDNMVIQRNTTIPIWGWADANEKVSVEASWGEKADVITGKDGTWKVKLKTPKAGGPFTIVISGKNTIEITNVLSGEVWLCTGQSNMDFAMSKFINNSREPKYQPLVEHIRTEIATAKDDWLRHIEVPQTTSLHEKNRNFKGSWISVNPEQTGKITATGYFFAKELRHLLNVPVGLVECSWGGTRIQPWLSENTYLQDEHLKEYFKASRKETKATVKAIDAGKFKDERYNKALAKWEKNGKQGRKPRPTTDPRKNRQEPATLYNGMLSAVIPYTIKGAIWYQGESNATFKPTEYAYYLTSMIKNWRADWNQGDFPFYYVQLASCKRANDETDKGWATVNDQMRKTLKVPNTGMAVLHDIGEAKDIHPHNKIDAGKRLALLALKHDYNLVIPVVNGPLYASKTINNNTIEIQFNDVGSGLMVGKKVLLNKAYEINEPIRWFEIAGKDNIWQPAEAKIIANNKIEVRSNKVPHPIHVRYAWSGNPEGANLYNKEGLPAAVFSTE